MKELVRALMAIGAGVVLGAFTAMRFELLWWLGMLVGGLVAYLVCDWAGVVRSAKHAWRYTLGITKEDWRTCGWLAVAASSAATTCTIAVFIFMLLGTRFKAETLPVFAWPYVWALSWILFLALPFIDSVKSHANRLEQNIQMAKLFNPFKIFIYWPILCLIWFFRLLAKIPRALAAVGRFITAIGRFIGRTLVMIHSEARLFCLVDAAIGVAVFHYTGNNLLVGLAVGEALGIIGHILVLRRRAAETKGAAPA